MHLAGGQRVIGRVARIKAIGAVGIERQSGRGGSVERVGQDGTVEVSGGDGPGDDGGAFVDASGCGLCHRRVVDGGDDDGGRGHRGRARAVGYFVGEAVGAVEVGSGHVVELAGRNIEADRTKGRLAVDRVGGAVACVHIARGGGHRDDSSVFQAGTHCGQGQRCVVGAGDGDHQVFGIGQGAVANGVAHGERLRCAGLKRVVG